MSTPSNTRTILCHSYIQKSAAGSVYKSIDEAINEKLEALDVRTEILSIQYQMSQNESFADTALIVYRSMI